MQNIVQRCTLFLTLSFLFAACSGKTPLEKYYFPLKKLLAPQVYEYRGVKSDAQLPIQYWYYQTIKQGDSIFFMGNLYDMAFETRQFVRETRVKNGMRLAELFIYGENARDSLVRTTAKIAQSAVFPFEVTDTNSIFIYDVQFENTRDSAVVRLIRNRRYVGKSEYLYKGKKYNCIDITIRERLESTKNGTIGADFTHLERFAEGIGLVYTRRDIGNGQSLEYELYDIYPMEQLEQKFKRQLPVQ
jgi:hypothetical protein